MIKILFVSEENACRSQMAEAFVNMHKEGGIMVKSIGLLPASNISEKARLVMRSVGYDLGNHRTSPLSSVGGINFDYMITIGQVDHSLGTGSKFRETWDIPDPSEMEETEFIKVRDMIESELKLLLGNL